MDVTCVKLKVQRRKGALYCWFRQPCDSEHTLSYCLQLWTRWACFTGLGRADRVVMHSQFYTFYGINGKKINLNHGTKNENQFNIIKAWCTSTRIIVLPRQGEYWVMEIYGPNMTFMSIIGASWYIGYKGSWARLMALPWSFVASVGYFVCLLWDIGQFLILVHSMRTH